MPVYEYVCTTCDDRFSRIRPMADADLPTDCDAGHRARRALSVFARSTAGAASGSASGLPSMSMGGGCCGGGCGCG